MMRAARLYLFLCSLANALGSVQCFSVRQSING